MRTHPRRETRHRAALGRIAVTGAACVIALTSLAALDAFPAGSASVAPTWVNYFFPLKVGWTCHEITRRRRRHWWRRRMTVSSIGHRADRAVRSRSTEGSSSTAGGIIGARRTPTLHYILTNGGQLISVPSVGSKLHGHAVRHQRQHDLSRAMHTLLSGGTAVSPRAHRRATQPGRPAPSSRPSSRPVRTVAGNGGRTATERRTLCSRCCTRRWARSITS